MGLSRLPVSITQSHAVASGVNRLCKPCANRRPVRAGGAEGLSLPLVRRGGEEVRQFLDSAGQIVDAAVRVAGGEVRRRVTGQLLECPQVDAGAAPKGQVGVPQGVEVRVLSSMRRSLTSQRQNDLRCER